MEIYLFIFIVMFLVPVCAIIFFTVSLCRYISGRKQMEQNTGRISYAEMRMRRVLLIISSVLMLFPLFIIALLIALVTGAIPFM